MKLLKWVLLLLLLPLAAHAQNTQQRVGKLTVNGTSGTVFDITPSGGSNRFNINANGDLTLRALTGSDSHGLSLSTAVSGSMNPNPQRFDVTDFDVNGMGVRHNLVGRIGYNTALAVGDHAFYTATESYFKQGGNAQVEWYVEYFSPSHAATSRPIGVVVPLEGGNADKPDIGFQALNMYHSAPTASDTVNYKFLASLFLDTGTGGNLPSDMRLRANSSSGNVDLRVSTPFVELDTRGISGGGGLYIFHPAGAFQNAFVINSNGTVSTSMDGYGSMTVTAGYNLSGATAGNSVHSFNVTEYDVNSVSRRNLVSRMGYNPGLASSDHAFYVATESYYKPGAGDAQTEWYVEYFSPDHMTARRPFFFFVPVEGANINAAQPVVTGYTSSGASQVFTITPPYWYFDGTSNTNGAILLIGVNASATNNSLIINNGADTFTVSPTGVVSAASLKTTGSAGSKKVVCVDTSTGTLYASSTGTDCSN